MTDKKDDDELSDTERFLRDKARSDAEKSVRLNAAREKATKIGKERFNAEILSRYYTPTSVIGAAHSDVLEALEEYEWYYYVSEPELMTLEEFGRKLTEVFSYES